MSTPARSSGRSGDDADEGRLDGDRAQVRVQAEPAAEREERLLRADRGARVRPLRAADRAEQDRVGLAAGGQVLVADGDPERVDRGAADDVLRPVDREPEPRAGRIDDPPRGRDDLRPDPVARDRRDPVRRHGAVGHGSVSPWRGDDERDRHPVDLGAVELVDRHEVALERGLDDVGR